MKAKPKSAFDRAIAQVRSWRSIAQKKQATLTPAGRAHLDRQIDLLLAQARARRTAPASRKGKAA
mgnify:CR=1 FL=1